MTKRKHCLKGPFSILVINHQIVFIITIHFEDSLVNMSLSRWNIAKERSVRKRLRERKKGAKRECKALKTQEWKERETQGVKEGGGRRKGGTFALTRTGKSPSSSGCRAAWSHEFSKLYSGRVSFRVLKATRTSLKGSTGGAYTCVSLSLVDLNVAKYMIPL